MLCGWVFCIKGHMSVNPHYKISFLVCHPYTSPGSMCSLWRCEHGVYTGLCAVVPLSKEAIGVVHFQDILPHHTRNVFHAAILANLNWITPWDFSVKLRLKRVTDFLRPAAALLALFLPWFQCGICNGSKSEREILATQLLLNQNNTRNSQRSVPLRTKENG